MCVKVYTVHTTGDMFGFCGLHAVCGTVRCGARCEGVFTAVRMSSAGYSSYNVSAVALHSIFTAGRTNRESLSRDVTAGQPGNNAQLTTKTDDWGAP